VQRRTLLRGAAAALALPLAARTPRAAERARFPLGIASGQPRTDGMVLWTRLVADDLAERVDVAWEVAADEGFRDVVARGVETAEAAWAHSVHAEPAGLAPGRWYWYRFTALGERSPAGRTRTAPAPDAAATFACALASCQRWDTGHYAAWRHVAAEDLDAVVFVGDYIYEYAPRKDALRPLEQAGTVTTLPEYRARYATHKSDPALQAAHARFPWLLVWDDHEVVNDYAGLSGGERPDPDFASRRAAAYRAYWEHMPFPKAIRPTGPDMRIYGRLDWGTLARIHLVDDRQYRDPQACPKPGRGGGTTVMQAACPELVDPKRTLLGFAQERWLADGWDLARPWNLLVQQTLMARNSWTEPMAGTGFYWTDGWDGYAAARARLLGTVAERKVPGVVVLGGDVHAHYVADLKVDFDDPAAPVVATEFCGTSISSLGLPQARLDAARTFNPHLHYGRSDQRGWVTLRVTRTGAEGSLRVLADARDPASTASTAARFAVDPTKPGAQSA
jgi:alkaline phosphatase D